MRLSTGLRIVAPLNSVTQRDHVGRNRARTGCRTYSNPMIQSQCPLKPCLISTDRAGITPILHHKLPLFCCKGVWQQLFPRLVFCARHGKSFWVFLAIGTSVSRFFIFMCLIISLINTTFCAWVVFSPLHTCSNALFHMCRIVSAPIRKIFFYMGRVIEGFRRRSFLRMVLAPALSSSTSRLAFCCLFAYQTACTFPIKAFSVWAKFIKRFGGIARIANSWLSACERKLGLFMPFVTAFLNIAQIACATFMRIFV